MSDFEASAETEAVNMVEDVDAEIDTVHDGVGDPFFTVVLKSGTLDECRLAECRRWGFNVADVTVREEGVAITFLFTGRPIN
ncbi:hypothetical protein [Halalkalicoccus subterraneus]|uniref:hypothetical protein n=1 Tax=Halalkalicoccus subterraneus TaxID=2675002 RepID=UPI000EFC56A8|nr:hypothetical protein [Halalkalicoccus subterraneus]